jgi:putative ABC transport system permease protein
VTAGVRSLDIVRNRLVPLRYPLRSLAVRWVPSLFTALGIALTVAVFGAVLSLREGFQSLFAETGREDVFVYLRPGAQSEGESVIRYPLETSILKERPEVARDARGAPLAAAETSMGLRLPAVGGKGHAIVTVRGIEPASLAIQGDRFRLVGGRLPAWGTDEVMVGRSLSGRVAHCAVGDELEVNVTSFRVVGVFDHDGAYTSEVWGDVDRVATATGRPARQRVIARARPGTDLEAVRRELESDKRTPTALLTERAYYRAQTTRFGGVLVFLATVLTVLMGAAASLGAVSTMLAAVGGRTREIGVLVSLGYGSRAVFVSFLLEAAAIGAVGGLVGVLIVLPLNGIQTATLNWNTLTEVAFAFRVSPGVVSRAVFVALGIGVLGGAVPAWRASRLPPTAALRRY